MAQIEIIGLFVHFVSRQRFNTRENLSISSPAHGFTRLTYAA